MTDKDKVDALIALLKDIVAHSDVHVYREMGGRPRRTPEAQQLYLRAKAAIKDLATTNTQHR